MKTRALMLAVLSSAAGLAAPLSAQERTSDSFWSGLAAGALAGAAGGEGRVSAAGLAAVAAAGAAGGAARGPRVTPAEVTRALERGAAYLRSTQTASGGWGVGTGSVADNSSIQAAITAYVVAALRESGGDGAAAAIRRGEAYIDRHGGASTAAATVGFPGNTQRLYGLTMGLSNTVRRERSEARDALARRYIAELASLRRGSTEYYDTGHAVGTFQLAMTAEALREASAAGFTLPAGLVDGIHNSIEASRSSDHGGYSYSGGGGNGGLPSDVRGTASRSLACEVAQLRAGRGTPARLDAAVRRYLEAQGLIAEVVRSTTDHHHPDRQNIAPYYQLFAVYWASEGLASLPVAQAEGYAHALGRLLVDTQARDGSWVDSRTYGGPSYGTASAMLSLGNVARALQRADRARAPGAR